MRFFETLLHFLLKTSVRCISIFDKEVFLKKHTRHEYHEGNALEETLHTTNLLDNMQLDDLASGTWKIVISIIFSLEDFGKALKMSLWSVRSGSIEPFTDRATCGVPIFPASSNIFLRAAQDSVYAVFQQIRERYVLDVRCFFLIFVGRFCRHVSALILLQETCPCDRRSRQSIRHLSSGYRLSPTIAL